MGSSTGLPQTLPMSIVQLGSDAFGLGSVGRGFGSAWVRIQLGSSAGTWRVGHGSVGLGSDSAWARVPLGSSAGPVRVWLGSGAGLAGVHHELSARSGGGTLSVRLP